MVPMLAIGLIIAVAFIVAMAVKNSQEPTEAVAAETPVHVPFSDLPDESPPDTSGRPGRNRGTRTGVPAPESLLQNANWQAAVAVADEGYELAKQSAAANSAGDTATYQSKAGEAHDKFDKAVTMTAIWEEEIEAKHGDGDPVVAQIMKVRTRWFNQMRKLRAQAK